MYSELRKGRHSAVFQEYLVTTVCHQRRTVFLEPGNADAFQNEIRRIEEEGEAEWIAWVMMPDHFHGLLRLLDRHSLSDMMRLLKGRTAHVIGGKVWQPSFHDRALRWEEDRRKAAQYLLANPMRAGISRTLRDYPYWYCAWMQPGDDPDEFLVG